MILPAFVTAACLTISLLPQPSLSHGGYEYLHPLPGSTLVSPKTTIGMRSGKTTTPPNGTIKVVGSKSGDITDKGKVRVATDERTAIFQPKEPFRAGENVTVSVDSFSWSFTISEHPFVPNESTKPKDKKRRDKDKDNQRASDGEGAYPPPSFHTVPTDFPRYLITNSKAHDEARSADGDHPLYLFTASRFIAPYLMILTRDGRLVWWGRLEDGKEGMDFRPQLDGNLNVLVGSTYANDDPERKGIEIDDHYRVVGAHRPGHGYLTDEHHMDILEDERVLMCAFDRHVTDGRIHVLVQEIDKKGDVLFEWRSQDFLTGDDDPARDELFLDSYHINNCEYTPDRNNILISLRNANQIVMISRKDGSIQWQLGGTNSDFTFVNDPPETPFRSQHKPHMLDNGHILMWDNWGSSHLDERGYSRVVEYALDTDAMTATKVWEWRHPDSQGIAGCCGSVQRLGNGHTLIAHGGLPKNEHVPLTTEVDSDGAIVTELRPAPSSSRMRLYRAHLAPWRGHSTAPPRALLCAAKGEMATLHLSYNGVTGIKTWRVHGADTAGGLAELDEPSLLLEREKVDYEEIIPVNRLTGGRSERKVKYVRAVPVLADSTTLTPSDIITLSDSSALPCGCVGVDVGLEATHKSVIKKGKGKHKSADDAHLGALQCQAKCRKHDGCVMFVYHEDKGKCALHDRGAKVEGVHTVQRVISGPPSCH
ncbi:unnamed protein product [Vitrella brassicaformis CCMP3155]|uniref:Apple domain-containing protein n=1 Tax=Vitrella brassicaformis (strain CCMP3155) TaxID=1169540 RepID=A0A0G4ECR3_VITBC|nr:unnamed protein product [Vitrella brassicaformis CCMP3155]|eukprot:CEL93334.1 unnamed protein product [Vitrella brassicaformis CCMP3155]